uniref:Uncharacterized protein n=1 Tax=Candidatus Kentrum sp. LFY TaxID=2126342 RepID=A0A450WY20_9GAMM|nr:MAG: Domain of unknown function (DUF4276) [Candidatus Kentron sp. LFY]
MGCKGLEKAVRNDLKESTCVVFILDRDGPMSKAKRRREPNSLINQVNSVVSRFTEKVYLVEVVNELEAWLLVDCLGIFCFFSRGHHTLPRACKRTDNKSEKCRQTILEKTNYKKTISKYSVGDTEKIEEAVSGGRGAKEYLTSFSKEIYEELHPDSNKIPNERRYRESDAPNIAEFIKLDRQTIKKNQSLEGFSQLISGCAQSVPSS